MRNFVTLVLTLKMIFACWTAGVKLGDSYVERVNQKSAVFADDTPVEKFGVSKRRQIVVPAVPPAPVAKPAPKPAVKPKPAIEPVEEAPEAPELEAVQAREPFGPFEFPPPDTRFVVEVHSSKTGCDPCEAFRRWHVVSANADNYPLRFHVTHYENLDAVPIEVRKKGGVPLFHWLDPDTGKVWNVAGWNGPEKFLESFKQVSRVPEKTGMVGAPVGAGESINQLFAKFAGPGEFYWKPRKAIGVYVDDTTYLQYSQLSGTVEIVNGEEVIELKDPKPIIRKKIVGIWWNVALLGGDTKLNSYPQSVTIRHSKGRYKLVIQDLGDK